MKGQRSAIKQELIDRATGKGREPVWEGEADKLTLVSALNHYSIYDYEKLYRYAVIWTAANAPDHYDVVQAQTPWVFQTFGGLMRLDSRGMDIGESAKRKIVEFLNQLIMPVKAETKPLKRKKKMTENINYRNFCDALDIAVEAGSIADAPEFVLNKAHSADSVIETCWRELDAIKEDAEVYPSHMGAWFRSVLKAAGGGVIPVKPELAPRSAKSNRITIEAVPYVDNDEQVSDNDEQVSDNEKQGRTRRVRPPKTPTLSKEEQIAPEDCILNGKRQAFLFDTRYGRLTRMVSNSTTGFSIRGKTIHNVDTSQSKVALLKDLKGLMETSEFAALEPWMSKCVKKGSPIKVGTRLADEIRILAVA